MNETRVKDSVTRKNVGTKRGSLTSSDLELRQKESGGFTCWIIIPLIKSNHLEPHLYSNQEHTQTETH